MGQRIRSGRSAGFCWASNDAIALIIRELSGQELNTTLGVYQGLTFLASLAHDGDHGGFEAPRKDICAACGVQSKTLDRYVRILKRLELLEVEVGGGSSANTWVLVDPPPPGDPPHSEPPGDADRDTPPAEDGGPLKKGSEEGEEAPRSSPTEDALKVVTRHRELMKPRRQAPDNDELRIVKAALKVATVDELIVCVEECHASDFHMKRGRHKSRRGGRHNTLGKILKPRPTKGETQRARVDFWLDKREERVSADSTSSSRSGSYSEAAKRRKRT
jgi:hypothetical protein